MLGGRWEAPITVHYSIDSAQTAKHAPSLRLHPYFGGTLVEISVGQFLEYGRLEISVGQFWSTVDLKLVLDSFRSTVDLKLVLDSFWTTVVAYGCPFQSINTSSTGY